MHIHTMHIYPIVALLQGLLQNSVSPQLIQLHTYTFTYTYTQTYQLGEKVVTTLLNVRCVMCVLPLFRDPWLSSNSCNMDAHRSVGLSSPIENLEPCRSSSSQVSNHELSSPSLEFTLGRPDWHGADHD
jgi:hypothetical protein